MHSARARSQWGKMSLRVLLVEDDPLISSDIAFMIEELGHTVIGPFAKQSKAIKRLNAGEVDVGVIDYNLGEGRDSGGVADVFITKGIPFAFTTGYRRNHLPERFASIEIITKPYGPEELSQFFARV